MTKRRLQTDKDNFPWKKMDSEKRELPKNAEIELRREIALQSRSILHAGQVLSEVKAALEHGDYKVFIESVLGIRIRTAQNYISAYRMFGERNSKTISPLSARAIYRLAAPSMQADVREEVLQALDGLHPDIRAIENRILQTETKESSEDDTTQVLSVLEQIARLLETGLSEHAYGEFRRLICDRLILVCAPVLSGHLQKVFAMPPADTSEKTSIRNQSHGSTASMPSTGRLG